MRLPATSLAILALTTLACAQNVTPTPSSKADQQRSQSSYVGFDRNDYPGDASLPALHQHFSFVGYWLNNPPGEHRNTWAGKRQTLLRSGFGFLVLTNGRLDAEILKSRKSGITPAALGQKDAAAALAAARREQFPAHTILFLDQEEGGRLLPEQSAYLLAWTEAVAQSGYLPGVYLSGQPVPDGPGKTITTVQDIRDHVAAQHLHPIAMWVYQDACPPSSGCTLHPPPLANSGTPDIAVWQYAQSPRRKDTTVSCAKTYASDGNCYAPGLPDLHLDLSVSASPDPSHGR
ncbi:MAG TPA: glycoside hydrolase domain-containing protein [Edaphobacter sp.]|nr:glycoside hydrolase domain-containing protein [Edaphobacter sp.]